MRTTGEDGDQKAREAVAGSAHHPGRPASSRAERGVAASLIAATLLVGVTEVAADVDYSPLNGLSVFASRQPTFCPSGEGEVGGVYHKTATTQGRGCPIFVKVTVSVVELNDDITTPGNAEAAEFGGLRNGRRIPTSEPGVQVHVGYVGVGDTFDLRINPDEIPAEDEQDPETDNEERISASVSVSPERPPPEPGDGGGSPPGGGACAACAVGSASMGFDQLGCSLSVGMGGSTNNMDSGTLLLSTNVAGGPLVSAASLMWTGNTNSAERIPAVGAIEQVRTPYVLAHVESDSNVIDVFFFNAADATNKVGNSYVTNDSPQVVWTHRWKVERLSPDPGLTYGDIVVLQINRGADGGLTTNRTVYRWPSTSEVVEVVGEGADLRTTSQSRAVVDPNTWTLTTLVSAGTSSVAVSRTVATYQEHDFGVVKIHEIRGEGVAAPSTAWHYETQDAESHNYGRLVGMEMSTGYWEMYQYDSAGRQYQVKRQHGTSAYGADDEHCRVTFRVFWPDEADIKNRVVTKEWIAGHLVAQSEERWSSDFATSWNLVFTEPEDENSALTTMTRHDEQGRVVWQRNPDGTALVNSYETGPGGTNTILVQYWGEPSEVGATNAPMIVRGTRTTTVVDPKGQVVSGLVQALSSASTNIVLSGWTATEFDSQGRPTLIEYQDGTLEEFSYGCCGVEWQRGRDGVEAVYEHDSLGRVTTRARQGVLTGYKYDAAGRTVSTSRWFPGGTASVIASNVYDSAGRLVQSLDALSNVTSHEESLENGLVVSTTTHPDNSTEIRRSYPDGSIHSIAGTASRPRRYEYGAVDNMRWTREILIGEEGAESEFVETWTDLAGRQTRVVYADQTTEESSFDGAGRLVRTVGRDGRVQIQSQDVLGWVRTNAVVAGGASIDFAGTDRITTTTKEYVQAAEGLPDRERTTTRVWTVLNSSSSTVASVVEQGLTTNWSTEVVWGRTRSSWATRELVNYTWGGTSTAAVPVVTSCHVAEDGTRTLSVSTNGLTVSTVRVQPDDSPISGQTNVFDSLHRVIAVLDSERGRTDLAYDALDRVVTNTVAVGTPLAQTTRYFHDVRGRTIGVVNPDGTTLTNLYHPTGELAETRGSRTYPVAYTYDPQGRMRTMTTWKDRGADAGRAVTRWHYSPLNGLLEAKEYEDGTRVLYHYAGGRLTGRTWARNVSATYSYNFAGDLTGVDYSDGTPDVSTQYDRLGRPVTIQDGAGVRSVGFTVSGLPALETSVGPSVTSAVERSYDEIGRLAAVTTRVNGVTLSGVAYGYDAAGRMASVTGGTNAFTYGYRPGSSLVVTSSAAALTALRTYDALTRLSAISNVPSQGPQSSWTYTNNVANQRVAAKLVDGTFWSYLYDELGQVIGGTKTTTDGVPLGGEAFGYAFDDIGNRLAATNNGQVSTYTANGLNQYELRTVAGVVDVLGETEAPAGIVVTVNGQDAARQGKHFHGQVPVDNRYAPAYPFIQVVAGMTTTNGTNIATVSTGHGFVPRTPERFAYDADGNMTRDGRWSMTWDAENRLVSLETRPAAAAVGAPRRRIEYTYDNQSRRTAKRVFSWTGGDWAETSRRTFVWDGWNLVAEVGTQDGAAVTSTFTWGLDLSGSLQGAGGVGGLLAIKQQRTNDTAVSLPFYDGNGNVMGLVDAADGTVVAVYEYDPFGDTLRSTGLRASANPWRFSTKYSDQESGWLYYGYRYYAPKLGRWVSRDPVEEQKPTGHPFVFVRNNGIFFFDFRGLVQMRGGCCCPSDIYLLNGPQALSGPYMGHSFTVVIRLEGKKANHCTSCSLKWEEITNDPYRPEMSKNFPHDFAARDYGNDVFAPWRSRIMDAPGTETIELTDTPYVGLGGPALISDAWTGNVYVRDLMIRISVEAASECPCTLRSVTWTAKQHLVATRGIGSHPQMIPIWPDIYFR